MFALLRKRIVTRMGEVLDFNVAENGSVAKRDVGMGVCAFRGGEGGGRGMRDRGVWEGVELTVQK